MVNAGEAMPKGRGKDKKPRHIRGVVQIGPRGEMPFDSKAELWRALKEDNPDLQYYEVVGWIGDGMEHGGYRYEYERG